MQGQNSFYQKLHLLQTTQVITLVGSFEFDLTEKMFTWTDALFMVFDMSVLPGNQVSFQQLLSFVDENDRPAFKSWFTENNSARLQEFNCTITTAENNRKHLHVWVQQTTNEEGTLVKRGSFQDVTKQRLLEQELIDANERWLIKAEVSQQLETIANSGSYEWNLTTNELSYSDNLYRMFGYEPGTVVPSPELFLSLVHPDDRQKAQSSLHVRKMSDGIFEDEYRIIPGHGHIRYINSRSRTFRNSKNELLIIGTLRDVTDEQNRLEELTSTTSKLELMNRQLEQKNDALEKTNNELASFSYVASHDLQEPLRKIRTFGERLLEREADNLSATGKDYLARMDNASRRMQQLIDDLLAFSRTNTMPRNFDQADLNVLVSEVKENLKLRIDETNATVMVDPLPNARVITFQFQQMLENLILNSLKYRKENTSPVIHVRYSFASADKLPFVPATADGQYHHITVEDNGIGFEQQYAEKIFEIFQRLHGKHEYSGTGVGLAIVKKTVENHHGFVFAQGTPGVGASFHIYLPA